MSSIMLARRVRELKNTKTFLPMLACGEHTSSCPASKMGAGGSGTSGIMKLPFARAEKSGECRMGFIPEEWFKFFLPKTGVSGPYVFGFVVANYLCSKEIFVMEHEYYLGLSFIIVIYYVTMRLGPGIGKSLDKEVDAVAAELQKSRDDELTYYQAIIKDAELAQWRAEGQKLLMDAKKENIAMQLEAVFRERCMMVRNAVKNRMDYHVKRHQAESLIHQKWMSQWVLQNVMKSITPEFQQMVLDQAIRDLQEIASKA